MPWVQLHARALSLLLVLGLCAPRSGRGTAKNEPVGETLSRGARHQRFARVGRVAPAARRTMPDAAEGPLLEKAAPAMRCKPSVHCAMGMAKVVCPDALYHLSSAATKSRRVRQFCLNTLHE